MKVIIAAAGTGGHINPGIAIANKIKEKESSSEIIFIGTNRGLEKDLVPRAGYKLQTIDAHGITRKITFENVKNIAKTLKSVGKAKKIIKEFKPDIVIGTGGYICGPVIYAAHSLKIPTMLHESNAFPGIAVKMFAKKVNAVLVGFEDAIKRIPKAKKIILTGTPTKIQDLNLSEVQKNAIKESLGFTTNLPLVLVVGGSQGAKAINETLIDIIKSQKIDYQIIWAAGPKQYEGIKEELTKSNINIDKIENIKVVPYIYNMEEIINAVDVVVARSGAMTITEIARVGKPAIFIPFPFATENHQEYNARVLENKGAAKIILNKDLNSVRLQKEINDIIQSKDKQIEMGNKAKEIAIDNVEERIYNEIVKILQ